VGKSGQSPHEKSSEGVSFALCALVKRVLICEIQDMWVLVLMDFELQRMQECGQILGWESEGKSKE
jgi:hypothetical protein